MNNLILNNEKMMSSLEIAELAGKMHKHVMESIRNMELRGKGLTGRNFGSLNIGI